MTVATVLTVYGIETTYSPSASSRPVAVATVLTVYGIETGGDATMDTCKSWQVATVLTVYGIETL